MSAAAQQSPVSPVSVGTPVAAVPDPLPHLHHDDHSYQDEKESLLQAKADASPHLCNPQARTHVRVNQADMVRSREKKLTKRHKTDKRRFYVMFVLTGIIFLLEMVFGLWSSSLTLLADALHMLSDFVALIIGYYSVKVFRKPRTLTHTYGLSRMEIVGALFNGAFMISSVLFITLEALGKLWLTLAGTETDSANLEDHIDLVLIVGTVGLVFNFLAIFIFGCGHEGGHGHSHGVEVDVPNKPHAASQEEVPLENVKEEGGHHHGGGHSHGGMNLNIYGVLIHVIGDALGSVAVVATALVVKYTTWEYRTIVDPLCSLFICAILCYGTIPLIKQSSQILLQNVPASLSADEIVKELLKIPGVVGIHEFHLWQLSSKIMVSSMHAVIVREQDTLKVLDDVKLKMHTLGVHSSTIQPEVACEEPDNSIQSAHGIGADACHDPICGEDCLERICCPIVATEESAVQAVVVASPKP